MSPGEALDLAASYALIREGTCTLEVLRDVVVVRGPDALSWLQGQISQDVQALAVGQSAETLVLSPQGKIDAYCRATLLGDDVVLLDVENGHGEALFQRLRRFRLRVKADLEMGSVRCSMIRGPESEARLARSGLLPGTVPGDAAIVGLDGGWTVADPVTWTGFAGFDLLTPFGSPLSPALDVLVGDPGAFEAARIEAGVPALGRELTDKTIPQEAGSLVEHTVSFTKGCYTGQELVARLDARGGNVAKRLRGVVLDSTPEPTRDSVLVAGDKEVGRLTSVTWSPGFSAAVALAYVRRDVVLPATATVMPGGGSAEIRELPLSVG